MQTWSCRGSRFPLVIIGLLVLNNAQPVRAETLADLQTLRNKRVEQLSSVYTGTRSDLQKVADATILSEQAIRDSARKNNVNVTTDEVQAFLIPMLTKQGLIDPTVAIDFTSGGNLDRWLVAQSWSLSQLLQSSETLLLWVKLAVRNTQISDEDLKSWVTAHPEIYELPARIQLSLSTFQRPASAKPMSRGLALAESLSPTVPLTSRDAASNSIKPNAIPELQLYLDLNKIDPRLRRQLEGKGVGDRFGPIALEDGTIVTGSVASVRPAVNLSSSPNFWQYSAILARLSKSNQQEQFEALTRTYVSGISDPAVRGIFGDVLGVVGTGVGALFGGVGAPVGGALGGVLGSWIDGQVASPSSGPPPMQPQFQSFPQAQPYQQSGFPRSFPSPFQSFAPPPPMQFIPPMPPNYGGGFPAWGGGQPPFMPWCPPIFFPMPMRMF